MPRYAQFNSSDSSPQDVIGWYDTEAFEYEHLPSSNDLVEATDDQWEHHFSNPNGWTVINGQLIAPNA